MTCCLAVSEECGQTDKATAVAEWLSGPRGVGNVTVSAPSTPEGVGYILGTVQLGLHRSEM